MRKSYRQSLAGKALLAFGLGAALIIAALGGASYRAIFLEIEQRSIRQLRDRPVNFPVHATRRAALAVALGLSALLASCGGGDPVVAFAPNRVLAFGDENSVITADGHKYTVNALVADANGVKTLSTMPGLPELRSKLLGVLQAPAAKLVRLLNTPAQQMVRGLKAHEEKIS